MFDKIGSKIKILSMIFLCVSIIASVLVCIIGEMTLASTLIIIPMGCIGGYIISVFAYAFGQLVENSDALVADKKASKDTE